MACEAFDKTDFHSKKISVGDKLPPGQIPQNYIARAAITANIPQKPTFPRPAKESKVYINFFTIRYKSQILMKYFSTRMSRVDQRLLEVNINGPNLDSCHLDNFTFSID